MSQFSDEVLHIEEGNYDINYISVGNKEGEVVILLHGGNTGSQNCRVWAPLLPFFNESKTLHFIAVDLPGHGKSTPHTEGLLYDANNLSASVPRAEIVVQQVIDQIRKSFSKEKVYLIGRSYGGALSIYYTLKNPLNVLKLVCFAPAYLNIYKEEEDINALHSLSQNMLLFWAKDDAAIPFDFAQRFIDYSPKGIVQFVALENGNHDPAPLHANLIAPSILEFLSSSSSS